ncbi:hypothetical protein Dform_00399 [Dehalogenimonas formicexedens]|uniref:Uncharacterized protein n=1 Tax=Dehalogenimonas formicexedens TaxID=1839801 RepID=A0A1P8F5I9_9CHLR|nr:hypothetical protein [Dehalogenimonas formicexedens]APV43757.1 hypothetical protein Dform_00399 [Dehalogenimonas formicexedens]
MFEIVAQQAVELFEDSKNRKLKDVLKTIKHTYHLSKAEIAKVKRMVENLLTWELLGFERSVDVC